MFQRFLQRLVLLVLRFLTSLSARHLSYAEDFCRLFIEAVELGQPQARDLYKATNLLFNFNSFSYAKIYFTIRNCH